MDKASAKRAVNAFARYHFVKQKVKHHVPHNRQHRDCHRQTCGVGRAMVVAKQGKNSHRQPNRPNLKQHGMK